MGIDWRTADAEDILSHLSSLDETAFEEAVHNEAFTEEHVRNLLKDPGLEAGLVDRISRESRFFKKNSVRVGLALHPSLPRVRGLEIIRYLYWRDLIRVSSALKVHPQLRNVAEQALVERVPDLTVGEKIAIARSCGRGVLRSLRTDSSPRVIEALLRNFRCTEEDAVFIAASSDTMPEILGVLARHPKWRSRASVRSYLVRNRRLGLPHALGLLKELSSSDLVAVTRQRELPSLLRQSAQRLLDQRRTGRLARSRHRR